MAALLHLGRFEEALLFSSSFSFVDEDVVCYALYKLRRFDEALARARAPLLRAQILFKLSRWPDCAHLLRNEGAHDPERETL